MDILANIRERLDGFNLMDVVRDIEITRRTALKMGAYAIYGLFVFCVVFAVRYYGSRADELIRGVTDASEALIIEYPHIDPQIFPPRMTLDYLRIYERKGKKPVLLMKDVDVRFGVFPLLFAKGNVTARGRAYGGLVEAELTTGMFFNTESLRADIKCDMVELQKVPQVIAYDRTLKGYATVDASISGDINDPLGMTGNLSLNLTQLDMDNRFPVVKGSRLAGYGFALDCELDDYTVQIARLHISGPNNLSMKMEGAVSIDQRNMLQSTLDLKGSCYANPQMLASSILGPKVVTMMQKKQKVPIKINGSLANPQGLLR